MQVATMYFHKHHDLVDEYAKFQGTIEAASLEDAIAFL